jgi:hypothetical protein
MIKTLRITSLVVVLLAACFVGLSVAFGLRPEPEIAEFLKAPSAIDHFKAAGDKQPGDPAKLSPLVKQAQAFALVLNPPRPEPKPALTAAANPPVLVPPPEVRPKFELIGTCYYPSQPQRSLALIDEPGKGLYWVRQYDTVGYLVIDQIKDASVVCKHDDKTEEVFVKRPEQKSEVKSVLLTEGTESAPSATLPRGRRVVSQPAPVQPGPPSEASARQPVASAAAEVSKEQSAENIRWLKKMMTDPESIGISPEEAKTLGDLGEIISQLEEEYNSDANAPQPTPPPPPDGAAKLSRSRPSPGDAGDPNSGPGSEPAQPSSDK